METEFSQSISLINAIENNRSFIVSQLLKNGVDTEVMLNGKKPLIIAVENNHSYNLTKLLEYGAKTEVTYFNSE